MSSFWTRDTQGNRVEVRVHQAPVRVDNFKGRGTMARLPSLRTAGGVRVNLSGGQLHTIYGVLLVPEDPDWTLEKYLD